jgi:hypothetical protein
MTPLNAENSEDAVAEIDGNAALVESNFTIPTHLKGSTITRKYMTTIRGSYDDFAESPSMAAWRPLHLDIFKSRTRYGPNVARSEVPRGDLAQAILVGMKVHSVESSFPEPIGISVSGCKGNYYTGNGERYAFITATNQNTPVANQIIATTNPYINSAYLEMYPGMTKDNLRTNGIMEVPGENYVFVDHKHPICEMMQENQETLQLDLANAALIDNRWYKVSKSVTDRCIEALEQELVNNLPLFDFTKFEVKASRMHGLTWDNEAVVCDNVAKSELRQKLMETQRHLNLVLEVTYAFP